MNDKLPLSVVINTKNSEGTLADALKSVESFASQIVIMDMKSSDKTKQIAKKFNVEFFETGTDSNYVEPARNLAISKATADWVFILDSDEEVTPELAQEIKSVVENTKVSEVAFFVARRNEIFGRKMTGTGWWPDFQLRLFKKGKVSWSDKIHSTPLIDGKTGYLPVEQNATILHHNFQHVDQYIDRLNRYTSIEAELEKSPDSFNSAKVLHLFSDEFFRRLFQEDGIKEGIHGVGLSLLQSMYQVATYLKVWERSGFPVAQLEETVVLQELDQFKSDLNYWIADRHVARSSGISKIAWQIRRKFRL